MNAVAETIVISAFLLLFTLLGVAGAYTISYERTVMVDGNSFTSSHPNAIVETFDNNTLLWAWDGNGQNAQGSFSGFDGTVNTGYSAPFGVNQKDTTWYMSVPYTVGIQGQSYSMTADLGYYSDYFGIWWGSVDTYNTLSFYDGNTLVASFTGSQAISTDAANGDQTAPSTNLYVNFNDLDRFNRFTMTSYPSFAFEADNIAVTNVPEPTTMLLLGLGLVGLAGISRRFKR